jgi:hypothetical protein
MLRSSSDCGVGESEPPHVGCYKDSVKDMEPKQRESLQVAVLRVLDANYSRFGLSLDAVTLHAANFGFPRLTREAVEVELEYLLEKGLVESPSKVLEPANRVWKRTASGRDYLAERGF